VVVAVVDTEADAINATAADANVTNNQLLLKFEEGRFLDFVDRPLSFSLPLRNNPTLQLN
jgi:hypothetical protein